MADARDAGDDRPTAENAAADRPPPLRAPATSWRSGAYRAVLPASARVGCRLLLAVIVAGAAACGGGERNQDGSATDGHRDRTDGDGDASSTADAADVPPSADDGPAGEAGGADGPDDPGAMSRRPPVFHPVRLIAAAPLRGGGTLYGTTLAIGDLTGDGRQDVALAHDRGSTVGDPGPRLSLFVQGEDGNLAAPRITDLPASAPTSLAILDVDSDGRLDLTLAHAGGLLLFRQTSAGELSAPSEVGSRPTNSGRPRLLATGHFDGDGLLDLVAATESTAMNQETYLDLLLFPQLPGGGLAAAQGLALLRDTHQSLAVGDLDGNGLADVAVAGEFVARNQLGVLRQSAAATFAEPTSHFLATGQSSPRLYLAAGDVTDDGRDDLLAAYHGTAGWLAVLRQAPDGSRLGPPELTPLDPAPRAICLGDLDGDDRKEVIILHPQRGVGVLRQRPGGGFQREELYRARVQFDNAKSPMTCGDVNGDGKLDVVIVHSLGLEVLLNRTRPDDSSACGARGQPCCSDGRCGSGGICNAFEVCIPCGGPGEPCCEGTCREGRCLTGDTPLISRCNPCPMGGSCDACGATGEGCCEPPARACAADQDVCVATPGAGGFCLPCGGPGQACCPGTKCSEQGCCHLGICIRSGSACGANADHGGICRAGMCDGCGQSGHTCCTPQPPAPLRPPTHGTCKSPALACDTLDSYYGQTGFCGDCGGPGQPCCGGNACASGGCCENNVCLAPGAACASMTGTCMQGSCGACGGPEQPCCSGIRCTAEATVCRSEPGMTGDRRCRSCGAQGEPCCAGGCRPGLVCGSSGCE
jgi:hypothetical protein